MAKLPEKEYGENEFSYREIYFMNDFDEYIDENNIDEDNDKDSTIGIQVFHFRLIIIEDIYYLRPQGRGAKASGGVRHGDA